MASAPPGDSPDAPPAHDAGRSDHGLSAMTVTGCEDCPLKEGYWTEDELEHLCAHPGAPEANTFVDEYLRDSARWKKGEKAPDWCPLRKGPLRIALERTGCACGKVLVGPRWCYEAHPLCDICGKAEWCWTRGDEHLCEPCLRANPVGP